MTDENRGWLESLVGKHILVGLTWVTEAGQVERHSQFHGRVKVATAQGVVVERADGRRDFTLPPGAEFIKPAAPGHYRLRESGEVIEDPDLVCTMRMVAQPKTAADPGE